MCPRLRQIKPRLLLLLAVSCLVWVAPVYAQVDLANIALATPVPQPADTTARLTQLCFDFLAGDTLYLHYQVGSGTGSSFVVRDGGTIPRQGAAIVTFINNFKNSAMATTIKTTLCTALNITCS